MLKQPDTSPDGTARVQPPSGGCVLKQFLSLARSDDFYVQPPSGGCVLKRHITKAADLYRRPAAFRRLCVETTSSISRICEKNSQPPSGGCVLKHYEQAAEYLSAASRLQAAVC